MTRIFISYDRDDRPLTRQIATQLRRVYEDVWYDEIIRGGEDWWDEIRKQIAQCDIFMFMLSEESIKSPYCKKETDEAISLKKEILPVRISPVKEIPDHLKQIQYVDMSSGTITTDNLIELTAAINRLSDKIAQDLRDQQTRLLQQRQRLTILRLVAGAAVIVALTIIALVTITQMPPFQGEIDFVSTSGTRPEIRVLKGGLSGLVRNVLRRDDDLTIQAVNSGGIPPQASSDSGFALSPDGSKIAFASKSGVNLDIYVMDVDGSGVQQITQSENKDEAANNRNPSWSPDGKQIAFVSDRDGNWEIYIMNADGSSPRNLTNNAANDDFPSWSPVLSVNQIAFASDRGDDWEIYRVDAGGGNPVNLTQDSGADDDAPAWSPNAAFIAYESRQRSQDDVAQLEGLPGIAPAEQTNTECTLTNWDVFAVDVEGEELPKPIASNRFVDEQYPAWSPDGQFIVYTLTQSCYNDLFMTRFNDTSFRPILLTGNNLEKSIFPIWRR
jgi:TolB protein